MTGEARGGRSILRALRRQLAITASLSFEDEHGLVATMQSGQRLAARVVRGRECKWLPLDASICRLEEMDPLQVLERAGRLAFATFVVSGGEYWLRVAVPCDSRELGDVGETAQLSVDAARSVSPVHAAVPSHSEPSQLFSHYL